MSGTLELAHDDLCLMYRILARTRALQEMLILNRRKIPGPLLTGIGQEAASVGSLFALFKTLTSMPPGQTTERHI